jgi:hypothetical protein
MRKIESTERISIEGLRALLGTAGAERSKERLRSSDLSEGVPRGALVEVSGPARTEWVARLIAENKEAQVAWVEQKLSLLPTALRQREVELGQIIFVEARDKLDWTLTTLLRSQLFTAIVCSGNIHDQRRLRRYQLLAEKANATVLLLSVEATTAWCIALQLEARRKVKTTAVRLLKRKAS